jgi:hypothetical protein
MRESLNGFLDGISLARYRKQVVIPIGVEDGGGVASEEGQALGELSALLERDDGEGSPATSLPIDSQVVGVCLGRGVSIMIDRGRRLGARHRLAGQARTLTRLVSQAFLEMRRLS